MTDTNQTTASAIPLTLDIDAIRDLTNKAGSALSAAFLPEPQEGLPEYVPVFINREAGTVVSLKKIFEEYRSHPERKTGTATVTTLESFIELVDRHKTDHSAIFANTDWKSPSLTAIIDYHQLAQGRADNGRHRVHYPFPLSEEWQAWIAQNGEVMAQAEFAEWIEDHIAELATPTDDEMSEYEETFGLKVATPAEIVTLSRGLKVHAETRVRSNVVLQSGEGEIAFEEEHRDTNGNKLVVPGLFIVSLAPFFLGDKARIPVRLRYRVHGGSVKWLFMLHRPDMHITGHINAALEHAAGATELPAYQGTPETGA